MKGDVSQTTFHDHRFSRVVAQQGRIQLDADWNEQQAILAYRMRALTADTFGHDGFPARVIAPQARAGFGLHVHRGAILDASAAGPSIALPGSLTAAPGGTRTPFSIAFWLKPAPPNDGATRLPQRDIAVRRNAAGHGEFALALDEHNHVIFQRFLASDDPPQTVVSRAVLQSGQFGHAVCVDTGDAMEIWIDGELDTRVAARKPSATLPEAPIVLGPAPGAPAPLGELEWIGVWKLRLLREDVRGAFMQHEPAIPPTLAWLFDPATAGGLSAGNPVLCAGPGRAYVGGRLCERSEHRALGAGDGLPLTATTGVFAFIDVWDQYVSAFEDPRIADIALDGLDTAGRLRTVARVGFRQIAQSDLRAAYAANEDRGSIAVGLAPEPPADNALYRFEVHAPGAAADDTRDAMFDGTLTRASTTATVGTLTVPAVHEHWPSGTFLEITGSRGTDGALKTLRIVQAVASPAGEATVYVVADIPASTGADVRVRPIASILWSRENAHGVFTIESTSSDTPSGSTKITLLDGAKRYRLLSEKSKCVVVITTPALIADGRPGIVTQISNVDTDVPGVVDIVVTGVIEPLGPGATLRVWDGILPVDAGASKPFAAGDLTVRFGAVGAYRCGDYWSAIVRPDAPRRDRLAWAVGDDGTPAYLPPEGISHVYALLGEVAVDAAGHPSVVSDFRVIFSAPGDADRLFSDLAQTNHDDPPTALAVPQETSTPPSAEAGLDEPPADAESASEAIVATTMSPLPEGALVLARHPLPGFAPTGAVVDAVVEQPQWRRLAPAPSEGPAEIVALEGRIYALFRDGRFAVLDPSLPETAWERRRRFEGDRTEYTLAAAGGGIYVIGGRDRRGRPSRAIDIYDPKRDVWTAMVIPLGAARIRPFATAGLGNSLMIGGGERRSWIGTRYRSRSVERYDLESERRRSATPLVNRISGAVATTIQGSIFLVAPGGTTVARFRLRAAEWSLAAVLDDPLADPAIAAVTDEQLVVADCRSGTMTRLRLQTGDMTALPSVPVNDCRITAANGVVYAVAGQENGMAAAGVWALHLVDRLRVYGHTTHHHQHGGSHGTDND